MDLGKLINEIANSAADENPIPDQASRQHLNTAGRNKAQPAEALDESPKHFRNLEDLRRLDDDAWHQLVSNVNPDDLVIVLAGVSDRIGLRILAPLDDESQAWILENARQLGTPTPHLRDQASERILAAAEKIVAGGAKLEPAAAPPSVSVGFGKGAGEVTGGSTTVTVGSNPSDRPATTVTVGSDKPSPAPSAKSIDAEDVDLARTLADLLALQEHQGRDALVKLAEEAPHPLLTSGLQALDSIGSRSELDQVLLDLQDAAERRFRAQCDLVRDGLTAIFDNERPTTFLARQGL